jgi:deoxycytidine triphosphate deaminase
MSVVSRNSLQNYIKEGKIVVSPEPAAINNVSIDVSLHNEFYRQTMSIDPLEPYDDSEDQYDVDTMWEKGFLEKSPAGVPSIRIDAQECLLVFSEQFIGGKDNITTMAKSKSSIARIGLDICGSSGWGDIGYTNRWCFCLTNRGQRSVYLRPGTWVAQIVFLNTTDIESTYSNGGQYQSKDVQHEIERKWKSADGLPKSLKVRKTK